jgi:hypothetical protein
LTATNGLAYYAKSAFPQKGLKILNCWLVKKMKNTLAYHPTTVMAKTVS